MGHIAILNFYLSANIEIYSLKDDKEKSSNTDYNLITDVVLPSSIFSNGIVIDLRNSSSCQNTEIGMMI